MTYTIKQVKFAAILASILLIGSCNALENTIDGLSKTGQIIAGTENSLINYQKCPPAFVVDDLSMFNEYATKSTRDSQLQSKATAIISSNKCSYKNKSVTVDTVLDFTATLGPKGRLHHKDNPVYSYPFFVAITGRDGKIMAKQLFAASVSFEDGANEGNYTEKLRQVIPVKDADDGINYAVMIGFQLEEDQLNYNRALIKARKKAEAPPPIDPAALNPANLIEAPTSISIKENTSAPVALTP